MFGRKVCQKKHNAFYCIIFIFVVILQLIFLSSCGEIKELTLITGISFDDKEFVYDGNPHAIYIDGELPEDIYVEYTGNGEVNVGSYTVTANFIYDESKYAKIEPLSANYEIKSQKINVEFNDEYFLYDGLAHSIKINSILPNGVEVTYNGNEQTEIGSYEVIASFNDKNGIYEIDDVKAIMTITNDVTKVVSFESKIFTYDEEIHSLELTNLPDGYTVTYLNNENILPGEYEVEAIIKDEENDINYQSLKATLTILRGEMEQYVVSDQLIQFDSKEHYIEQLPEVLEGINIECFSESAPKYPGTYEITIKFKDELNRYNDYQTIAFLTITDYVQDGITYIIEGGKFIAKEFDGSVKNVVIPAQINLDGDIYYVSKLEDNLFLNSDVESIEIGNGIIEIGNYTFKGTSLNELFIPNSVVKIGENILENNFSIEQLTLPYIGKNFNDTINNYTLGYTFGNGNNYFVYQTPYINGTNLMEYYKIPSSLKTIRITNQKSLPNNSFMNCVNLDTVVLDITETIGINSFENCTNLKNVESINTINIKNNAFINCSNLENANVLLNCKSIESNAFENCKKLMKITVGPNLLYIDDDAFLNCDKIVEIFNLSSLDFEKGSISYGGIAKNAMIIHDEVEQSFIKKIEDISIITIDNLNYLIEYPLNSNNIILPELIDDEEYVIGNRLFNGSGIKTIIIPKTVKSIGDFAFNDCEKLNKVEILGDIVSVGNSAFANCTNLSEIEFNDSLEIIGERAFYSCGALKEFIIPRNTKIIGEYAFYNVGIKENIINEGLITVSKNAFFGALLKSIELPNVEKIEEAAFENSSLESVSFGNQLKYIEDFAFTNTKIHNITIPDSCITIGQGVFNSCSNLNEITLPFVGNKRTTSDSKTTYAFGYIFGTKNSGNKCNQINIINGKNTSVNYYIPSSLNKVTITDSKFIPYGAFRNVQCSSLIINNCIQLSDEIFMQSKINNISLNGNIISIPYRSFYGSTVGKIILPNSIETIGNESFYNAINLIDVNIPSSLNKIGQYAFSGCSKLNSIILNEGLETIEYGAFKNCIALNNIVLPSSIKKTGYDTTSYSKKSVFEGCTSLKTVGGLDTNSNIKIGWLEKIPNGAFYYSSIEELELPNTIVELGSNCISNCSNIKKVKLSSALSAIPDSLFSNCVSLENIVIPEGITKIGTYAFSGCSKLNNVIIPEGVTEIGVMAFYNCNALDNITIPNSVDTMGYDLTSYSRKSVFMECPNLKTVGSLESDANIKIGWTKTIPSGAFYLSSIEEVQLNDSIVNMGDYAFNRCFNLTSVNIPSNIKVLNVSIFSNCTSLANVVLPEELEIIKEYAFYNTKIEEMIIPNTVIELGYGAFNECALLNHIVIPASIEKTGYDTTSYSQKSVFMNTPLLTTAGPIGSESAIEFGYISSFPTGIFAFSNLISVDIPDGFDIISENSFYQSTALKNISIPESVTTIEASAFSGCSSLNDFEMPSNLEKIDNYAFYNCDSLTSSILPSTLTYLGNNAFAYCDSLSYVYIPELVNNFGYNSASYNLGSPFRGCTELITVGPSSIITHNYSIEYGWKNNIPAGAFIDTKIKEFVMTDTITNIGNYAFYNCTELTSVSYSKFLTAIGDSAFYNCKKLENIEFISELLTIGDSAFCDCDSLDIVNIPNTVKSIGTMSFGNCDKLYKINIPKNCSIGTSYYSNAFSGSNLLKTAGPEGTNSNIGFSVDTVLYSSYFFRTSVEQIILQKSVLTIQNDAFGYVTLKKIYYLGDVESFSAINMNNNKTYLATTNIYYYSEEKTESNPENYWHYNSNNEPVLWSEE